MNSGPLHLHLRSSELFASLDETLLSQLEAALTLEKLHAGDTLVKQGDIGDAVFILVAGQLEVSVDTAAGTQVTVDVLGPGASVGEMALVAGQVRTATVSAKTDAELVRLARPDFEQLAEENPGLREAVIRQMEPRLQRVQLSAILEQWFPDAGPQEIRRFQDSVDWLQLAGGEHLYRKGDAADGMYLLVSGRLRVVRDGDLEPASELGRGASIGELAVLDDSPRTESVIAIRDSQLVRLDRQVVAQHPQVMAQIARNALARIQVDGRAGRSEGNGVKTVAIVPANPGAPAERLARSLEDQLETWGPALLISDRDVNSRFGRDGAANTERHAPLDSALSYWLNETESRHDFLLLLTDGELSPWTKRCLGQADAVLVVADSHASETPGPVEGWLADRQASSWELALVHPPDTELPTGTARWLDARPRLNHHHVRLDNATDTARLARRLHGRAYGLALSGGGARGYVHLGLIRALEELGVPVDMVAGTSMGALIGAGYALSLSHEFCFQAAKTFGDPKKLLDRTLPLVALAESRNVTESFRRLFGDALIEDLWIPFTCVSANLTRAEPVLHQRGPVWKAVRASTAIPGVFTPVVHEGDVLVDGGIMNNYPVDLVREQVTTGQVIGSNAESAYRNKAYDFGESVSGWRVLLERFRPAGSRRRYPSILGTLMRATSVSSKHLGAAADALADVTVRYPAEAVGNLEFDRVAEVSDIGHKAALDVLSAWFDRRRPV